MVFSEVTEKSPMRILEKSIHGGMGPGNLGVILARAGVGKTACLVHIATDRLFLGKQVAHVSIGESADRVKAWYTEIIRNMMNYYGHTEAQQAKDKVSENRVILTYSGKSFDVSRLSESLANLKQQLNFNPSVIVVDDLDFETTDRSVFEQFKDLAGKSGLEIWFTARCFQEPRRANEQGIPYPCDRIDDLFDVIVLLDPQPPIIKLQVLKGDGENIDSGISIHLDPKTMLLRK